MVDSVVDDVLYDEDLEDYEEGVTEYDLMISRLSRIADDYGYEFDHLMGAYLGGCLDAYFPDGLPGDECSYYYGDDDDEID